jgi:hypothetical protein
VLAACGARATTTPIANHAPPPSRVLDCTLTGEVYDVVSRTPASGVTVIASGGRTTNDADITDETGRFKIPHALGRTTLEFFYYDATITRPIHGCEHVTLQISPH